MAGPAVLFQTGNHAGLPAASAGCVLYACSTHSKVYKSDGSTWTDWMTIPTGASVATDTIFDAKGDSAWGTGADTSSKLTAGSNGQVVVFDSAVGNGVKVQYPPGYEFDYVEKTSSTSITATAEASADTVVTAGAVVFDGSTTVYVEFYSAAFRADTGAAGRELRICLYDGSSSIGQIGFVTSPAASATVHTGIIRRKLTPSAASHTYSIRAFVNSGTGTISAGAGGSGAAMPAFIRIVKA